LENGKEKDNSTKKHKTGGGKEVSVGKRVVTPIYSSRAGRRGITKGLSSGEEEVRRQWLNI